jgi:surface polysaccharide O-acyltransferase-like enzyme
LPVPPASDIIASASGASSDEPKAGHERISEYDFLRLIAIVAVVVIHVTANALLAWPPADRGVLLPFVNDAVRFAVPSFLFVTGALVWSRPFARGYEAYRTFLRRRFRLIVVPYLFWSAVYLVVKYAQPTAKTPRGFGPVTSDIVTSVVTGRASFHLYFVPTIVMMYMAAPFASRVMRSHPLVGTAGAFVCALWGPVAAAALLADWVTFRQLFMMFVTSLPYVAVGAWFGMRRKLVTPVLAWTWPVLLTLSAALAWSLVHGSMALRSAAPQFLGISRRLIGVLGFIGLGAVVIRLRPGWARALEKWGLATYGVYLMHPLVLAGIDSAILATGRQLPWLSPAALFVQVALVTLVSFGFTFLLGRSKVTAWTV